MKPADPHPAAAQPPSPGGRRVTPATPLFVNTHDCNVWLCQHTQRFPKHLRHSYTNRLESSALEFEEALLMANAPRRFGSEAKAAACFGQRARLTHRPARSTGRRLWPRADNNGPHEI